MYTCNSNAIYIRRAYDVASNFSGCAAAEAWAMLVSPKSSEASKASESTVSHHLSSTSNWERGISAGSETSKKRVGESIATDFIRAETVQVKGKGRAAEWQALLERLFRSQGFNHFMALVVILDAYCNCYDIDARAANLKTSYSLMMAA